MRRLAYLLFPLICIINACSTSPFDENDPGALLKDAEEDIQSEHYQIALDKLRIIKNKFPYSKYAVDAHLRIADVYYMQESFPEAAGTYEAFKDLHPKHDRVPYAMFRGAESYFNDIPSPIARDLTTAQKSLDAYLAFLQRFPTAPEADPARKRVVEIRRLLAEKELYVGDFYYKRDFYDSAKPRYKKIIELYSETEAAKKAAEKLSEIAKHESKESSESHGQSNP